MKTEPQTSKEKQAAYWLKATENCHFRPSNVGVPWEESWYFTKEQIPDTEAGTLKTDNFIIFISKKTPFSLEGRIWGEDFILNAENRKYSTDYHNVSYNTYIQLTLCLNIDPIEVSAG
jgi:hypothetical protein